MTESGAISPRKLLAPLALAQFICSFAGSNMNVMINDISEDLDTTVQGVQATITLFASGNGTYVAAMIVLGVFALIVPWRCDAAPGR